MKCCLRQWVRPTDETKTRIEGVGDCQTCTYDEHNKNCRLFIEINVTCGTVEDYERAGLMPPPI